MRRLIFGFLTLVFLTLLPSIRADSFSFVGNLRTDANVLDCGLGCTLGPGNSDGDFAQWAAFVATFHVSSTSTVQALTFSYGGGTNGNAQVIPEGGFEPYLSLFDSAGNFLASTFFGTTCPPGANTNSGSGQCFDVLLDGGTLGAGDYQIAISAWENMSLAENGGFGTLADGFTGLGNLFPGEDLNFAFDVTTTRTTPVPEPSAMALMGFTAFSALAILIRRKR